MTAEERESLATCDDIFNRVTVAEKMSDLLCDADKDLISPATLQGMWGSGKTVHASRMEKYIREERSQTHRCVYWNAAETDYADDPLPIFVAILAKAAPKEKLTKSVQSSLKLCWEAIPHVSGEIIVQVLSNVLHVDLKSVAKAAGDAMRDKSEIKEEQNSQSSLSGVSGEHLPVDAAKQLVDSVSEGKELIIIIDELDRCRPDYALKIIERIKHLFTATNCKFLLVVNKGSLISSISHLYGFSEQQSALYLNKFIKLDLLLPPYAEIDGRKLDCVEKYIEYKLSEDEFKFMPYNQYDRQFISCLFLNNRLQFREVDKFVNVTKLIYSAYLKSDFGKNYKGGDVFSLSLAFASYLIAFRNDIIVKLISKNISAQDILDGIGITLCNKNHANDRVLVYMVDALRNVVNEYLTNNLANQGRGYYLSTREDHYVYIARLIAHWFEYSSFLQ